MVRGCLVKFKIDMNSQLHHAPRLPDIFTKKIEISSVKIPYHIIEACIANNELDQYFKKI
jgi:hypothetical protein